jgi:O-acetylserine/cysteine efflux transporter
MTARRVTLVILVLVLAWGSTFAAVKVGLAAAPPVLFAGLRSLVGGAVMALPAALRHGGPRIRGNARVYILLTALNVIGFFGLQTLAILELPSGLAAVLIYLQPVITGVLAAPLLGEGLGATKVAGMLLAFAGIVVVSSSAIRGHVSATGVVYATCSALLWSLGTIAFKRSQGRLDPWWAVALPFLAGGAVLTVAGLVTERVAVQWSGQFVAALAYSGLVGTALAWALWFALVGSGEASRASTYIFFVPLVSLVIGVLFLGEQIGLSLLAGSALVVGGVSLVNRRSRRPRVADRERAKVRTP